MWARLGRERLCPAGQEELPCACHVVLMPVLGMQRTGEHWFWGCTGNARGKAWQCVLVWAGDTPGWVCDSALSPCQSGGRWMRKAAGGCRLCPPRTQSRHWHSPAGEAGTSRLLEMTLPGS